MRTRDEVARAVSPLDAAQARSMLDAFAPVPPVVPVAIEDRLQAFVEARDETARQVDKLHPVDVAGWLKEALPASAPPEKPSPASWLADLWSRFWAVPAALALALAIIAFGPPSVLSRRSTASINLPPANQPNAVPLMTAQYSKDASVDTTATSAPTTNVPSVPAATASPVLVETLPPTPRPEIAPVLARSEIAASAVVGAVPKPPETVLATPTASPSVSVAQANPIPDLPKPVDEGKALPGQTAPSTSEPIQIATRTEVTPSPQQTLMRFSPVFRQVAHADGHSRFNLLDPFGPFLPEGHPLTRITTPLFSVFRVEQDRVEQSRLTSVLWNLYRQSSSPEERKYSLLFGAFQRKVNSNGKARTRLFWINFGRDRRPT